MKALLIETAGDTPKGARPLNRISIAGAGAYDERWLQNLLYSHPDLLPIGTLDLQAGGIIPVCRELPIPGHSSTVFLDILGVTPQGRLVLVECKLWRNPQSRRDVVGQILEYASLLRRWRYADLTARIKPRLKIDVANPLFDLVRERHPEIGEAAFVDAVSRSLATGDFELIIAGDGIRSDLQAIGEHFNDHPRLASRLTLVEIQIWTDGEGSVVVSPFVPLRTEVIRHRVMVDMGGSTTQRAVGIAEQPLPITVEAELPHDRTVPNTNRAFWQAFIDEVRFDHADQAPPRHGGNNWVRLSFPAPIGSATVFRSKNRAGVFFRLKEAERSAFDLLQEEQEGLREDIDPSLAFIVGEEEPFVGLVEASFPLGGTEADDDAGLRGRLADLANRFVSAFRLRLATMAPAEPGVASGDAPRQSRTWVDRL